LKDEVIKKEMKGFLKELTNEERKQFFAIIEKMVKYLSI